MLKVARTVAETALVAKDFLELLEKEVIQNEAVVVGLYGDLGSGKTTFAQALAKLFGVTETVTSPTFVIEKIYKVNSSRFSHLIHIDAYRLESGKELERLGWKDILGDPKHLILIEWPERVADILPKETKKIHFTFVDETTRKISY